MSRYWFFFTLIFLFVLDANSAVRFELRGSAGGVFPNPKNFNEELGNKQVKQVFINGMVNGDALLVIHSSSGKGVALGVRRDWQGIVINGADGGNDEGLDLELKRTAAVLGYRFVTGDKGLFGFIGTYGVQHEMKLEITRNQETESYSFGKAESVSGAIEAGFLAGPVMFRAETGFQSYLVSDIKNVTADEDENFDVNLGGFYTTLGMGLSF